MALLAAFYYGASLSVPTTQITALRELAPASRLLYGTDFPFANEARLRAAEDAFNALSLSDDEQQSIRRENAAPFFATFHGRCGGARI